MEDKHLKKYFSVYWERPNPEVKNDLEHELMFFKKRWELDDWIEELQQDSSIVSFTYGKIEDYVSLRDR